MKSIVTEGSSVEVYWEDFSEKVTVTKGIKCPSKPILLVARMRLELTSSCQTGPTLVSPL